MLLSKRCCILSLPSLPPWKLTPFGCCCRPFSSCNGDVCWLWRLPWHFRSTLVSVSLENDPYRGLEFSEIDSEIPGTNIHHREVRPAFEYAMDSLAWQVLRFSREVFERVFLKLTYEFPFVRFIRGATATEYAANLRKIYTISTIQVSKIHFSILYYTVPYIYIYILYVAGQIRIVS